MVLGSKFAEGLLREDSWGQVRWFTLEPARRDPIERLTLESFDNRIAPTVFAMTSE